MAPIPRTALILGLAGTLPFIAGAAMTAAPDQVATLTGLPIFAARLAGSTVLIAYSTVILCFMSGALWGFATKSERTTPYVLSVLPALFVFFNAIYAFIGTATGTAQATLLPFIIGFAAILILDRSFTRAGLAPAWWLKLRLIITAIVLICLGTGYALA